MSSIYRTKATFMLFCLSVVLLLFAANSNAAGTMPYTDDALAALNTATEKIKAPGGDMQGDGDIRVRTYIATYKKIFAVCGYDYERSIIKIINDIQFDRYRVNKATLKLNVLARELMKIHVSTGVHPEKYLSEDCARLLIEFRNLIRSNSKKYGGC